MNLENEINLFYFQTSGLDKVKDVFDNSNNIYSIRYLYENNSISPENISLAINMKEENILLKVDNCENNSAEDYMNDINNWGMFNENTELKNESFSTEDYMNDFIKLGIFDENSN
jgi:hypothetical protein